MIRRKNLFQEIDVEHALEEFIPRLTPERFDRLTTVLNMRSRQIIPVMEDLYQEQNAGAVIRSAECCGFQEVGIIERNNVYNLAPGIAKGAQKWIDVRVFDQQSDDPLATAVKYYRNQGFKLIGACPHERDYQPENLPLDQPMAIFFGAEKMGLHEDLRAEMDGFVAIPMRGFTESYNVSVSAAIILQTIRQRLEFDIPRGFLLHEAEKREILLEWVLRSFPRGMDAFHRWKREQ